MIKFLSANAAFGKSASRHQSLICRPTLSVESDLPVGEVDGVLTQMPDILPDSHAFW